MTPRIFIEFLTPPPPPVPKGHKRPTFVKTVTFPMTSLPHQAVMSFVYNFLTTTKSLLIPLRNLNLYGLSIDDVHRNEGPGLCKVDMHFKGIAKWWTMGSRD